MNDDGDPLRIVEAQSDEALDQVRRCFRAYATEFEWLIGENLRFQDFEAELAGLPGKYAGPSGALLLATVDDHPAGCVALRDLGDGVCEMKRLYVSPEFRGRGLGKALITAILRKAKDLGHRRMVLDTIPEMGSALDMYRSFGFVETAPYAQNPVAQTVYLMKDLGG